MSLLTVERSSPSPHESDTGENEDLLSTSSYEGFMAREHYAMCLSHRPMASMASLGPIRRGDQLRIFSHLRKVVKLLRPQDSLKLAVELENNYSRPVTKYLLIVATNGYLDTEETIVLGTEQEGSNIRMCMVLALWRDTEIKLDGDGGFSVHTGDRHQVFKPSSVQSMWTALQMLYNATAHARMYNFYVGGLSHTWMAHYISKLTDNGAILNEWNLLDDIESFRPDSPVYRGDSSGNISEERYQLEKLMVNKLRDIMLQMDLEEVTSKQLRMQLEREMSMELSEYKGYLDQQMLRILGQMERPSEIYDYLYLGSEWNASNLQELREIGVKCILNVTKEIDNFYPEEFKYLNIRLYDLPSSELMKHWDLTYAFIKEAKDLGKKVLVHCKMGISRSAATVVAFAMKEYRMPLKDALAYVKGRRSVVNPNDGFLSQLRDYEGILRARHNALWGRMAPSRPLLNSRLYSMSEPNLPDFLHREQRADHSPELHLPEIEGQGDRDASGKERVNLVPLQSISHLPPQLMPVDKDKHIQDYLASLPSLQTIDDDQGIGGIGENTCTSESGSGSSSPILTPTDDEQFNLRHKLAKEIKSSKRPRDSNTDEVETGYYSQTSSSQVLDKTPSLPRSQIGIPPKPYPPANTRPTKSKVSPPPSGNMSITTPMQAQIRQPIALANQLPYKVIHGRAHKAVSVPHSLALAHSMDPLTSSPPKLSTISPESSKTSLVNMALPEALDEELDNMEEGECEDDDEDSIMITVTDSKNNLIQEQSTDEGETATRTKERDGHARQSSDGALLSMSVSDSGGDALTTDSGNQQHRRAKSDGDNISGPTQIPSVPDRVKEIEEMNGGSTVGGASSYNTGGAQSSTGIFTMSATPNSEENKKQSVCSLSTCSEKRQSESLASMSRTSSQHSLSTSSHSVDEELVEISATSNSSPQCVRSTRHGSLSPNPPSIQMKIVTEQTRCTSMVQLPQTEQVQRQQKEGELNDDNLASSLLGAVKARVQDIEEKNKDNGGSVRSKSNLEKSEGSTRKVSPSSTSVEPPLSEVGTSPDSGTTDTLAAPLMTGRRRSPGAQRRPSSEVFVEREPDFPRARLGRRESTPPALLSAWSRLIPADGVPSKPVQDLKQKFEDSTKSLTESVEVGPRGKAVESLRKGSNLRRSQSLRVMGSPVGESVVRRKRKKASCEEPLPVCDACSQD